MDKALFHGTQWFSYKQHRLAAAKKAVDKLQPAAVAASSDNELTAELMEQVGITPIVLHYDHMYRDDAVEIGIPFRGLDGDFIEVRGTRVVVHVPFTGDQELFRVSPSTIGSTAYGEVRQNEVLITWIGRAEYVLAQAPAHIDQALQGLRKCAGWSLQDCHGFNTEVRNQIGEWLRERRDHLQINQELGNVLDIPRRPNASALLVPVPQRRRLAVASASKARSLDPQISDSDYAAIVEQLSSARHLIERLPETFAPMKEVALRDVLLLILNNNFGPAGGEVFSRAGKTDILIQHQEGAVFIAECKKWSGAAPFQRAVDQLLEYLVWRDTKAALILFVRERDVTSITDKATAEIAGHERYVRDGAPIGVVPTFILHHEGDPQRHIRVALLVIPIHPVRPPARPVKPAAQLGR